MSITLRSPWLTLIGIPFAKQSTKELKGDWEELYEHNEAMSKAAGVRKPNGSQKAEGLWKIEAAKDLYDPERKDNILGRNMTRLELWEEHLKDPIVALVEALKCVEKPHC